MTPLDVGELCAVISKSCEQMHSTPTNFLHDELIIVRGFPAVQVTILVTLSLSETLSDGLEAELRIN